MKLIIELFSCTKLKFVVKCLTLSVQGEVLGLLRDAIVANISKTKCFLIDGYPRELEQGLRFDSEVCVFGGRKYAVVVV